LKVGRAYELTRILEALEGQLAAILRSSGVPEEDGEDLLQDALLAFILKRDRCTAGTLVASGSVHPLCAVLASERGAPAYRGQVARQGKSTGIASVE